MVSDPVPDAMHLRSLSLQNVRAFQGKQTLDFLNQDGTISRWCLILGENGVGKTTILQAIGVMCPVPAFAADKRESPGDVGAPDKMLPALSSLENTEILHFARRGTASSMAMEAVLETSEKQEVRIGMEVRVDGQDMKDVTYERADLALKSEGPVVIGYGAARHVGHNNQTSVHERTPIWSLFSDAVDLYDAEEIIEQLHHASVTPGRHQERDAQRYRKVLEAVAAVIPDVSADDIVFKGPKVPGRTPDEYGVHLRSPHSSLPLTDFSLGYQAVFAWTIDLAYRLQNAFPDSPHPLEESAVVLVDEIDLHLHPRWQRDLRKHLLTHFPNVQFIATTHSPVTAQEALGEGGAVAVVRWENGQATILNNPLPGKEWGYDQILTSDLFGFVSSRGSETERVMQERVHLARNPDRTKAENERLAELNRYVATLPVHRAAAELEFERLMEDLRKDFPNGVPR